MTDRDREIHLERKRVVEEARKEANQERLDRLAAHAKNAEKIKTFVWGQ